MIAMDTVIETDVTLPDGRVLHVYDTGGPDRLAVFWHHGTPNIGAPPRPLFADADRLGLRWVSHDRPGYGGSTAVPGRDIALAAHDVACIADSLAIDRFAVMGHSGGGPHAIACAALLAERVTGVVGMAGLAPFGADGLDWFAGMAPDGVASLQAALDGPAAKEARELSEPQYDPQFTPADMELLSTEWGWLGSVVAAATKDGPGGLIADDLAYVAPWGFDPAAVRAPMLLLHGGRDRVVPSSHSEWLASRCPTAQLRLTAEDGHLSVLRGAPDALRWLRESAG
jgi:pimeloyl-ACP methyl ester carboxylesterase